MDLFDEVLNIIRDQGWPQDFDSMVGVRVETNLRNIILFVFTKVQRRILYLTVYFDLLHTDLATSGYGWAIGNPKRWED